MLDHFFNRSMMSSLKVASYSIESFALTAVSNAVIRASKSVNGGGWAALRLVISVAAPCNATFASIGR